MAGVQKEIWRPEIIGFLEQDNQFLRHCVNADEYVQDGKIVYIPQAGTPATIVKNRQQLPAPIAKRTDSVIFYELDEYTSDPILLTASDAAWLSYDKRQSIIREKMKKMEEDIPTDMLYNWAKNVPTANKLKTSGANTLGTAPSATGNRKAFTQADVRAAEVLLNKQNVARQGRYMLVDSDMLNQLMDSLTAAQMYAFKDSVDVANGTVGRLFGFTILERGSVLVAAASGDVVKTKEAAAATDDNATILFWQSDMVERAYGNIELFENNNDPTFYGDIMSCLAFAGGRARRSDNKGVGLLIADA
jgi:hypothetical protein